MLEALSQLPSPIVQKMMEMLNLEQAIYAPLLIAEKARGLLVVAGVGIDKSEISAVATFANQIAIALTIPQINPWHIGFANCRCQPIPTDR